MTVKKKSTRKTTGGAQAAKPKKAAARTTTRRTAAKKTAPQAAKPVRAKKPAGATTRRAKATPVATPPLPPTSAPPFSGAITGASAKHLALFQVVRARVTVHASIQGIAPGGAEDPLGEGKWNARQVVIHLAFWDREFQSALEPALRGVRPEWAFESRARVDRRNAEGLDPLSHLTWDEALRRLHVGRQELMDAIESVPEEPAAIWSPEHALGWLVAEMARHDLHHATSLKQWRAAVAL